MIRYVCNYCGKEFWNHKSKQSKYCSNYCYYKSKIGIKRSQYIIDKISKSKIGHKYSEKFKITRKKSGNPNWKGDNAAYSSIHCWVRKNFKDLGKCENCGHTKFLAWANKDHKYSRNRKDWMRLCERCHQRYDYKYLGRGCGKNKVT